MDKNELIERINEINKTAKPEFLAKFSEADLAAYLEHLMELNLEEVVARNRTDAWSVTLPSQCGAVPTKAREVTLRRGGR